MNPIIRDSRIVYTELEKLVLVKIRLLKMGHLHNFILMLHKKKKCSFAVKVGLLWRKDDYEAAITQKFIAFQPINLSIHCESRSREFVSVCMFVNLKFNI